jgi:hypothetical protein
MSYLVKFVSKDWYDDTLHRGRIRARTDIDNHPGVVFELRKESHIFAMFPNFPTENCYAFVMSLGTLRNQTAFHVNITTDGTKYWDQTSKFGQEAIDYLEVALANPDFPDHVDVVIHDDVPLSAISGVFDTDLDGFDEQDFPDMTAAFPNFCGPMFAFAPIHVPGHISTSHVRIWGVPGPVPIGEFETLYRKRHPGRDLPSFCSCWRPKFRFAFRSRIIRNTQWNYGRVAHDGRCNVPHDPDYEYCTFDFRNLRDTTLHDQIHWADTDPEFFDLERGDVIPLEFGGALIDGREIIARCDPRQRL